MPKHKDLKRLVRARMRKTGESYTSARAKLLARPGTPTNLAELAGMSDAALKQATGCNWGRWVPALDALGAATMTHRDIAKLVREKYKISSWWSQAVTVGYERIRGLREKGQSRGGTYTISKSRTYDVPVEDLYAAVTPPGWTRWLDGPAPTVRKATAPRSVRIAWHDGSRVELAVLKKGAARSQVQVEHGGLASKAEAERMRAWWTERLAVLGEQLG